MSVLSEKREIDAETVGLFIPKDDSNTLPALTSSNSDHSYENERKALYKILYELQTNVSDLRREMNGLRKQIDDAASITAQAQSLSNHFSAVPATISENPSSIDHHTVEDAVAEEIADNEPENLNLNDQERQAIIKSLERNNGNRSKTAQELGISSRTLYRKLKLYGLT